MREIWQSRTPAKPGINHDSSLRSHHCRQHKCRVPHGPGSPGRCDGCEGLLLWRSDDKNNKNLMKCLRKCFHLHFSPGRAIQSLMIPVNKSHHTFWHVDLDYNIRPGRMSVFKEGLPGIWSRQIPQDFLSDSASCSESEVDHRSQLQIIRMEIALNFRRLSVSLIVKKEDRTLERNTNTRKEVQFWL